MKNSVLEAERILHHLRCGVVPSSGIEDLTFGRDELIVQAKSILESTNDGGTTSMVIKGEHGVGKSHACAVISKMALDADFAVSLVNVHEGLSWTKMLQAYNHVLMNVQVPDLPNVRGIKQLLREWMRKDTKAHLLNRLKSDLEGTFSAVPAKLRYGVKAIAYFYDRAERNILNKQESLEREDILIQWLTGEDVHTTKVLRDILLEVFKKLSLRALSLTEDNIFEMLDGFLMLLRFIGYSGLIVLIDEGENALEHSYTQRAKIYRNLNRLLTYRSIKHLSTIFAISPSAVLNIANHCKENKMPLPQFLSRSTKVANSIYDLKPLPIPEMQKLATVIRQFHSVAHDWDAKESLSDETISDFCERMCESGRPIRHLIRRMVEALDMAEQSPHLDVATDILSTDVDDEAEETEVVDEAEETVSTEETITETVPPTEPIKLTEPVKVKTRRTSTSTRTRRKNEPEFIPIEPTDKDALAENETLAISTIREYLIALEDGYQQTPPNVLICETAIKALQRTNQLELIRKMKGKIPVSKMINDVFAELGVG